MSSTTPMFREDSEQETSTLAAGAGVGSPTGGTSGPRDPRLQWRSAASRRMIVSVARTTPITD
eukprot:4385962-Pyramimonas_sp.AAC.1